MTDYTKNYQAFMKDYFKTEPLSTERRKLVDGLMEKIDTLTDKERIEFSELMEKENKPFREKVLKQIEELEKNN